MEILRFSDRISEALTIEFRHLNLYGFCQSCTVDEYRLRARSFSTEMRKLLTAGSSFSMLAGELFSNTILVLRWGPQLLKTVP